MNQTTQLANREDEYRCILNVVAEGIFSVDMEGRFTFVNPSASRMLGYSPEELIGRDVHQQIHHSLDNGAPSPASDCDMLTTLHDGKMRSRVDDILWRKDGNQIPVEYTCTPLERAGLLVGAVVVFRDISKHRKAEQVMLDTRRTAEQAVKSKSDFLSTMSHEIRTPMNGILGMTQILRDTDLNPEQREFVDVIHASGKALLALINDALDLSKMDSAKMELDLAPFDLFGIANDVYILLLNQAEQKRLELVFNYAEELPHQMIGDQIRLRQILLNLVGNAIKFTARGRVELDIGGYRLDNQRYAISMRVHDTGIGIEPEAREKLFQPFTQADSSTTRKYGGTGLGLAITRGCVDLMGGQISIDSTPGEGSTFLVQLNLAAVNEVDTPDLPQRMFDAKLLLVEDAAPNQLVARTLPQRLGIQVDVAQNGSIALEHCAKKHYDLIFMDCKMPVMDGFETTRRIREAGALNATVPIVALTASSDIAVRNRCIACGMSDLLVKPMAQGTLIRVLKKWLPARAKVLADCVSISSPAKFTRLGRCLVLNTTTVDDLQHTLGEDFIELVLSYLGSMQQSLQALSDAWRSRSILEVEHLVHSIRSASANLGAERLAKLAGLAENNVKRNGLIGIQEQIAELETEFSAVARQLHRVAGVD